MLCGSFSGNWSTIEGFSQIVGPVAIEIRRHTYIKSLDNGAFVAGAPHADGADFFLYFYFFCFLLYSLD
jgi:phage-related protein